MYGPLYVSLHHIQDTSYVNCFCSPTSNEENLDLSCKVRNYTNRYQRTKIIMTNQWEAVFNGEKKKLSLVKTTHPRPIQRGKPIFIRFEDGTSVGWVCCRIHSGITVDRNQIEIRYDFLNQFQYWNWNLLRIGFSVLLS